MVPPRLNPMPLYECVQRWICQTAHGVVTEAEVGFETLSQRLALERESVEAAFVSDMIFGASGRAAGIVCNHRPDARGG